MADVQTVDIARLAQSPSTQTYLMTRRRHERVMYYRKPKVHRDRKGFEEPYLEADWIGWGDTQDGKRLMLLERGWQLLPQFGVIHDGDPAYKLYGPWGAILTHPAGPAAFPVDQIKAYRWYHPDQVPVPGTRFPQLAGEKIVEYACPECTRLAFHEPVHLGRHLKNGHQWLPADLDRYSNKTGIDFAKAITPKGIQEFVFTAEEIAASPTEPTTPAAEFEIETVKTKGRAR